MTYQMIQYEKKLIQFIDKKGINAEHLIFDESIHTVADCTRVTGFSIDYITKSIIMVDQKDETIIGLIPAKFRVSTKRVGKLLGIPLPIVASPEKVLEKTGYPAGGMPFIGYIGILLVDNRILEKEYIFTGGGSSRSLLKIPIVEILKLEPLVARIRK